MTGNTSLLAPESNSLNPLPASLRSGLTAISVVASISCACSTMLFLYLAYKLVKWHIKPTGATIRRKQERAAMQYRQPLAGIDNLGFLGQESNLGRINTTSTQALKSDEQEQREPVKQHPNQFVVLLLNLLLADMYQSISLLLSSVWVYDNAIEVGTGVCWVQGFLGFAGDLASSLFTTFVAIHIYLIIIWEYKLSQWTINTVVVLLWLFVYMMVVVGVGGTHNGRALGGFFVRAGVWVSIDL